MASASIPQLLTRKDFRAIRDRFDAAWQNGDPPRINEFLPPGEAAWEPGYNRKKLLCELVKIDLECRWQADHLANWSLTADGARQFDDHPDEHPDLDVSWASNDGLGLRPRLEDYLRQFPELGSLNEIPIELIEHEIDIRRLAGDPATDNEYMSRFRSHGAELSRLLAELSRRSRNGADALPESAKCPKCQAEIDLTDQISWSDLACPGCGESVQIGSRGKPESIPRSGSLIGPYKLVSKLGEGAFGLVYKARDLQLPRYVAIKLAKGDRLTDAEKLKFRRDAEMAAQLDHPNIVKVIGVGDDQGRVFIASQFIEGVTLEKWIKARAKPPDAQESIRLAQWCRTLALALHHAHTHIPDKPVIHRDVKPSNILLDADGQLRLIDFGLAKQDLAESIATEETKFLGTVAYMPPEQAQGKAHEANARNDVYSLGVVLFELLTGYCPYRGDLSTVLKQLTDPTLDPPAPRSLNRHVPRELEWICLMCLQKEPSRRYASTQQLAEDLDCFLQGEPLRYARRTTRLERAWKWCRRRPAAAAPPPPPSSPPAPCCCSARELEA